MSKLICNNYVPAFLTIIFKKPHKNEFSDFLVQNSEYVPESFKDCIEFGWTT